MGDDLIEAQKKLQDYRVRILAGEVIPPEELAGALDELREARQTELLVTPRKKATKKKVNKSAES